MKQLIRTTSFAMLSAVIIVSTAGCASSNVAPAQTPSAGTKVIHAVGAENEYANVIQQIGGRYVAVSAIMSNPSVDPHAYEASTTDASLISGATLVIQNGLGYDSFMNQLENSSPNPQRTVIDVASALGYSGSTPNPHLWYDPTTMPRVAKLIAHNLAKQDPAQAAYFKNNLKKFDQSLQPWLRALALLKKTYRNDPVAVTEPIANDLLQASGLAIQTPWTFQAAIMNGVDPSPQVVQIAQSLFNDHQVKVLLYNQQAVSNVTTTFLNLARQTHIPVIGVYETMPPNDTYQTWMETTVNDLQSALRSGLAKKEKLQ